MDHTSAPAALLSCTLAKTKREPKRHIEKTGRNQQTKKTEKKKNGKKRPSLASARIGL
jgi:hypothetical protein